MYMYVHMNANTYSEFIASQTTKVILSTSLGHLPLLQVQ